MKRIESGGANECLGDDTCPGVPESEETNPGFSPDGFADNLLAVLELCQDGAVEVDVEVQHRCPQLAICSSGDRGIDQATNSDSELVGDPKEERELIVGVDTGHRNNDLFGIPSVSLPHSL